MDLSNLQDQDYDENNEEEHCDNDIYLIELHKRLTMMKKDRKKAEQDTSLLDNRLKLLKGEEEKVKYFCIYLTINQTWKKIEVTKKKTQEKIVNIQKMEDTMRMKNEVKNI